MGSDSIALNFGVELELPLAVTDGYKQLLDDTAALEHLQRLFEDAGLLAYASACDGLGAIYKYSRWAITLDTSIEVGRNLRGVGTPIEIKSPKLRTDSNYEELFLKVWAVIRNMRVNQIEYWKMASTHVHFSVPEYECFPLDWAQKLAFCIIYFERAIDDLVPGMTHKSDTVRPGGWRKCDRYTKRNRVRPSGGAPLDSLADCCHFIFNTRNIQQLANLICYEDDDWRRYRHAWHKNWKWNFRGLKSHQTIEFRHMPPSRNAQETLDWITFATRFVNAARHVDNEKLHIAMNTGALSFREALGLELPREENWNRASTRALEEYWAAGRATPWMTQNDLENFTGRNAVFWERMIGIRDSFEDELFALNPPETESKDTESQETESNASWNLIASHDEDDL